MDSYRVDDISKVQSVLLTKDPHRQVMVVSEVTDELGSPKSIEELKEFPDSNVSSGTKIYQKLSDGRIFKISVLRG